MKKTIKDLVKFSTYARMHGKSVPWVHSQAKENKIEWIIIDGVHFVKVVKDVISL